METFIVLGLCFILYEALDLFHSCYTNQQQQGFGNNSDFSSGSNFDDDDSGGGNTKNSNNDAICVTKDTAKLVRLDSIEEIDSSDDNQSIHFNNKNKVFSICESVVHNNFHVNGINNNNDDDNHRNLDDIERLIAG